MSNKLCKHFLNQQFSDVVLLLTIPIITLIHIIRQNFIYKCIFGPVASYDL